MATVQAQTVDSILGGALKIVQPAFGYRFAIDSILLARFVRLPQCARMLELGAGCGVVSVIISALYRPRQVIAVELQPELAEMIAQNAELNGIPALTALCADIREQLPGVTPGVFDYVIANPPYRAASTGRQSPHLQRRVARSGDGATLGAFVNAAARYAKHGGKVAIVFTASRTAELVRTLTDEALEPKRIRFVHSRPGESARMVLIEARKAGGVEVLIEPPLFIYDSSGTYSEEARAMLGSLG
jgi:tRNA1Val (adenine37-N6)-methyltransferase